MRVHLDRHVADELDAVDRLSVDGVELHAFLGTQVDHVVASPGAPEKSIATGVLDGDMARDLDDVHSIDCHTEVVLSTIDLLKQPLTRRKA